MTRTHRRTATLLSGALVLATAACGTTLPLAQQRATEPGAAATLGSDGDSLAGVLPGGTESSPVTSAPARGESSADPGAAGALTRQQREGVRAGQAASTSPGRATDRSPVQIGFLVQENSDSFYSSVGVNASSGDHQAMVTTLVNDLNSRGGLGGRRVQPVYAAINLADPSTRDAQSERACSTFLQDNKVAAVVSGTTIAAPLIACLHQARKPLILGAPIGFPLTTFNAHPLFAATTVIAQDRMWGPALDQLIAAGYLTGTAVKTGIVTIDNPQEQAVVQAALLPALKRHGQTPAEARVTSPEQSSNLASISGQMQSAVLRFQSSGVTHVLFQDYSGILALTFMLAAESQSYRPRYGLTTYSLPAALLAGSSPKDQLTNSLGVGWSSYADVAAGQDPPATRARAGCLDAGRRAGQNITSRTVALFLTGYCDALAVLARQVALAGSLDPAALSAGLDNIGTSVVAAGPLSMRFTRGHHDGVGALRDLRWDAPCGCFRYSGAERAV